MTPIKAASQNGARDIARSIAKSRHGIMPEFLAWFWTRLCDAAIFIKVVRPGCNRLFSILLWFHPHPMWF